jgi:hypothetical protein
MRSKRIFPALLQALLPHRHRFILKDNDCWNAEWNALYRSLTGHALPAGDTVSAKAESPQHTLFDSVSDTVSHTPSNTVSGKEAEAPLESEQYGANAGNNTVSDTVSHTIPDTLSDRVSSTVQHLAPPEPEPEPHPKPQPEKRDDDGSARVAVLPVDIIKAFDQAIVEVYGANMQRPWPHGEDTTIAQEFIASGADLELCRQVFLRHLYSHQRKGKHPIGSLAYFRSAIPDALKERAYYRNHPTEVLPHDSGHHHAKPARPRSGHDAFTDALVEVVHEREQH